MSSFVTPNNIWRLGAAFATTGVVSGAFGAHGLKSRGYTTDQIHSWELGSSYAIYNGLALLAISLHPRFSYHKFAAPAIALGTVLFSGSIFALTLNRDRLRFLGPVTPLGGFSMIAGYISLVL